MTDDYIRDIQEQTLSKAETDACPTIRPPNDGEYIRRLMKGTTTNANVVRVIGKERRYVEDYSEVPEGATLQEGPEGGLYYETEQVEQFQREMQNMREMTMAQYDWSEEQIAAMESEIDRFEATKEEDWNRIMTAGRAVGSPGGSYRIKGLGSACEKVYEREDDAPEYQQPEDLNDIFASTVLAEESTEASVQETTNAIVEEFGEENVVERKDYLDGKEKAPFYRAEHLLLDLGDGKVGEIQVKSKEMKEIAHVGHIATYKNKVNLSESEQDEVADCLTSMMDVTMGHAEEPDCTGTATYIIQEVHEHGDEAEV